MTGKVKFRTYISSEENVDGTRWKNYPDATLHFRDRDGHTLILNDKNIYYIIITNTTVEGNSLLIEADAWKIEQSKPVDKTKEVTEIEFRLYPHSTNN